MQILKRKVLFAFLALLLLGNCTAVFAAGNTAYEGLAAEILYSPGGEVPPSELFPGTVLAPGKTVTDSLEICCSGGKNRQIALYLSTSGIPAGPGGSLLAFRVETSDGSVLYEGPLGKATGWLWLGNYSEGEPKYITFTVSVPDAMESTVQKSLEGICWRFLAEELPDESPQPKTGDEAQLALGIGLMCFSGTGLAILAHMPNFRRRYTGFAVDFTEEM